MDCLCIEAPKRMEPKVQSRRVAMVKRISVSFFSIEVNEEMVDRNKCPSTDYKISFYGLKE